MPSRMVSVSGSVNLSLHHKVQKFSSGTGSHGWSLKNGRKTVVVVVVVVVVVLLKYSAVSCGSPAVVFWGPATFRCTNCER